MKPDLDTVLTAIRLHCLECSGGQRNLVEHCAVKSCKLRPYRSLKAMGLTRERQPELTGQIDIFHLQEVKNP